MISNTRYFVEDDFLSQGDCILLASTAQNYFESRDMGSSIHGGRQFHPNTDLDFRELLKLSKEWKKLDDRLSSEEFFQYSFQKLGFEAPGKKFRLIRLFTSEFLFRGPFFGKVKKYTSGSTASKLPTQVIAAILATRCFHVVRRLIIGGMHLLSGKKPIELLYDYSVSTNGYGREIHRDSDARRVVFLVYLNELSGEAEGGALEFYNLRQPPEKFSPQPDDSCCELTEAIKPIAGRLVCFRNSSTAYHAVRTMKGHRGPRHFIYGGFTQLVGKNSDVANSTKQLKIEWSLYS